MVDSGTTDTLWSRPLMDTARTGISWDNKLWRRVNGAKQRLPIMLTKTLCGIVSVRDTGITAPCCLQAICMSPPFGLMSRPTWYPITRTCKYRTDALKLKADPVVHDIRLWFGNYFGGWHQTYPFWYTGNTSPKTLKKFWFSLWAKCLLFLELILFGLFSKYVTRPNHARFCSLTELSEPHGK